MKTHLFRAYVVFFLFLTALNRGNSGNHSESDSSKKNKFRDRKATDDSLGYPNIDEDALLITECPQKLELRWQTEVSSSIYSSPLIADINSDGKSEVVLPTFVHYLEILEGSDGDKLPGWPAFHQSTVHSSPLLYDIDKDGVREIVLATYNGEVLFFRISGHIMSEKLIVPRRKVKKNWYVGLHPDPADRSHPDVHDDLLIEEAIERKSFNSKVREKFPLEMAEIHGDIAAADINDDGKIEMVTTDAHGNVAAWSAKGEEIWETHLKSFIPQGPSVGDVDGDGSTNIVVTTSSGKIYVLNGTNGAILSPYPFTTHGQLMNRALLVDLSRHGDTNKGLTIATTSFDGYLYLIHGPTSCADVVDIGEMSYSMVLADNIDGGDDLDLLVTTMNGNVLCFSTSAAYNPLKAWRTPTQGRNNVAIRHGREGVYVLPSSRLFRDEGGSKFWVEIEIVDGYMSPTGAHGPYNITVNLLVPQNYQEEMMVVRKQVFYRTGRYRVELPVVTTRAVGTVVVEMTDRNGLYFSDEFVLTFHMHFYRILKWLLALPMLAMFGMLLVLRPLEHRPLPSFSRSFD